MTVEQFQKLAYIWVAFGVALQLPMMWLLHQVNKGGFQPGRRKKHASNTSGEQPKTDESEPEDKSRGRGK